MAMPSTASCGSVALSAAGDNACAGAANKTNAVTPASRPTLFLIAKHPCCRQSDPGMVSASLVAHDFRQLTRVNVVEEPIDIHVTGHSRARPDQSHVVLQGSLVVRDADAASIVLG